MHKSAALVSYCNKYGTSVHRFMRVDLKLETDYVKGMDLHKLAGNFS